MNENFSRPPEDIPRFRIGLICYLVSAVCLIVFLAGCQGVPYSHTAIIDKTTERGCVLKKVDAEESPEKKRTQAECYPPPDAKSEKLAP